MYTTGCWYSREGQVFRQCSTSNCSRNRRVSSHMNAFTHTKNICAPTAWSCPAGQKSSFNNTASHPARGGGLLVPSQGFQQKKFERQEVTNHLTETVLSPNSWHQRKQVPVGHYKVCLKQESAHSSGPLPLKTSVSSGYTWKTSAGESQETIDDMYWSEHL